MMRDHYDTLGLDPEASEPEIKAAYRTLVRSLHPDLKSGGEGGATDRLLEVQRAYEILSHPGRRASYDAGLPEGLESMLREGGVAEALADVLTVVRDDPAGNGGPGGVAVEPRMRHRTGTPDRSAAAPAPPVDPAPELPTPSGDRTFLAAIAVSVVLAGLAGALALSALAGAVGLVELLTFLLVALLAPVLALLASWVLSYTDGRIEDALRRGARRLRTVRHGVRSAASAGPRPLAARRPPSGEPLRVLVLMAAGGVYALVGAAPTPFVVTLVSGVGFALLHRVRVKAGPRRLLMALNLLLAAGAIGLAAAAWHGSGIAAAGALAVGGDTGAAELIRRGTGVVGALVVTVVLYVSADLWHDLADRAAGQDGAGAGSSGARGARGAARAGRRALLVAGAALAPIPRLLALALEGLAALVRTCRVPGTIIRRAVGGGWL